MKLLLLAFCLFSWTSAFAQDKAAVKAAAAKYSADGKALLTMINSGKVDQAKAKSLAYSMADQAVLAAKEYIKKDPKSEKLLTFVIGSLDKLKGMTFVQLEKDWHDAATLTKDKVGLDLKDEKNEKYMDPLHSILHPIMTAVAIAANDLPGAKDELTEGLEQMKFQEAFLTK